LFSGVNGGRSFTLASGVALHAINVYIAITVLPSVVKEIGGLDYYAWNTSLFVAASILGATLCIKMLDVLGPRGAYGVAALVFAVGGIVCASALSMSMMLVGRVVQGLSGGLLLALSYAMIRTAFHEELWPRAVALVSGMWGVATLIGPAVGGMFAELDMWRAAFWIPVPVALVLAIVALIVLPRRSLVEGGNGSSLPIKQLCLLTAAVLSVSAGGVSSSTLLNILGLAVGAILFIVLVYVESNVRRRMLPIDAFRVSTALGSLYATMWLLAASVTGAEIFLPLFLQTLHHQSPLAAGYLSTLVAAAWTLGSIISSGANDRSANHAIMAAPVLCVVGMLLLAGTMSASSSGSWLALTPICLALIAIGLGVGLAWPHLLTRVIKVAPADEQNVASAAITTVQLFATAVSAALAGLIASASGLTDPGGPSGMATASKWLFGAFTVGPILCIFSTLQVINWNKKDLKKSYARQ
jgi:MFS family permease